MGKQKQKDVPVNPEKFLSNLCKCYLVQFCDYIRCFCYICFATLFPPKTLRKLFLSQIKCQDLFCGLEQLLVRVTDFLQPAARTGNLQSKFEKDICLCLFPFKFKDIFLCSFLPSIMMLRGSLVYR